MRESQVSCCLSFRFGELFGLNKARLVGCNTNKTSWQEAALSVALSVLSTSDMFGVAICKPRMHHSFVTRTKCLRCP